MKKLLALLLALVMVLSVMTVLAACGDDESSSDNKTNNENGNKDDDNKNDDSNTDDEENDGTSLHGLHFDIPSGYEVNGSDDDITVKKDGIRIDIKYEKADYDSAEEAAEKYADGMDNFEENTVESGDANGVYYVTVQEEGKDSVKIVAYYMEGEYQWRMNATVEDFEADKDEVIAILTSAAKK